MATTLKLSEELKERVHTAAREAGVSPHAFMLSAIEQQTALAEQRAAFVAAALAGEREAIASGKGYEAREVHAYLEARVSGDKRSRPKAKNWRK